MIRGLLKPENKIEIELLQEKIRNYTFSDNICEDERQREIKKALDRINELTS